jgi:hypothetical protein
MSQARKLNRAKHSQTKGFGEVQDQLPIKLQDRSSNLPPKHQYEKQWPYVQQGNTVTFVDTCQPRVPVSIGLHQIGYNSLPRVAKIASNNTRRTWRNKYAQCTHRTVFPHLNPDSPSSTSPTSITMFRKSGRCSPLIQWPGAMHPSAFTTDPPGFISCVRPALGRSPSSLPRLDPSE